MPWEPILLLVLFVVVSLLVLPSLWSSYASPTELFGVIRKLFRRQR